MDGNADESPRLLSEMDVPLAVRKRIPEWRKKWRELWFVEVEDRPYAYRAPTRGEVIQHNLNIQSAGIMAVDEFVQVCLLYPDEIYEDLSLGGFMVLYDTIWSTSYYLDQEAFDARLAELEQVVWTTDHENILIMLRAFPGLLPEKINSWQPEELMLHIAYARALIGIEPQGIKADRLNLRKRRRELLAQMSGAPPPSPQQDHGQQKPEPVEREKPRSDGSTFDWESDARDLNV